MPEQLGTMIVIFSVSFVILTLIIIFGGTNDWSLFKETELRIVYR